MLWISKLIVDRVVAAISTKTPVDETVWWLLGVEVALAVLGDALSRATSLSDSLLGDRFTNHVSLRMMAHATQLDLVSFEDPVFYDKMERARRQTSSRLGMLASLASMAQQAITLLSLSVGIIAFSPLLLLLLMAAVIPRTWAKRALRCLPTRFCFAGLPSAVSSNYLRMLGASNSSAKEVKIFGLGNYLTERARRLFDRFYAENRGLAVKRAVTGTLLNLLPTAGYYAAYAYILYRALSGSITVGDLTFLTAAFARSRGLIEQIFASFSGIAEQAFFIEDLFDFFKTKPTIASAANAILAPRPAKRGFEFRDVSFAYPGSSKLVLDRISFYIDAGERIALVGRNRGGEDNAR